MRFRVTAAFVVTAGCGGHFEVPEPVVALAQVELPTQEPGSVVLPVNIELARVRQGLDSVFPPADSLDRARCTALGGIVCHQYVYRRDSLDLRMRGDRVTLATHLRYRARVVLPGVGGVGSCGYAPEDMRRADLRVATTLYWRNDWRLASRGTTITTDLIDDCDVTLLHVDATPTMRLLIGAQAGTLTHLVDSIIPAVADLRPAVDSVWRLMQRALPLDSASRLWLVVNPASIQLAPLSGSGESATTAIVLTANPRVVAGERPGASARPLPVLSLANAVGGIHLPVQIEIPFSDLSARVTAILAGDSAGKETRVNDVKIWGVGDTAVVRISITGRVSGALFMLGRVVYDAERREVLVRDLRYTLASDGAMSRIKATLGAGRIRSAVDQATGHGTLQIGQQLDSLRTQLTAEMNRVLAPGVTLIGQVRDIQIGQLYTTATAFVLRVVLEADAHVEVHE